ncbi:hypothetical protein D3C80_1291620 [compost metagenome]
MCSFSVCTTLPVLLWAAALESAEPGCMALTHSGSLAIRPVKAEALDDGARPMNRRESRTVMVSAAFPPLSRVSNSTRPSRCTVLISRARAAPERGEEKRNAEALPSLSEPDPASFPARSMPVCMSLSEGSVFTRGMSALSDFTGSALPAIAWAISSSGVLAVAISPALAAIIFSSASLGSNASATVSASLSASSFSFLPVLPFSGDVRAVFTAF